MPRSFFLVSAIVVAVGVVCGIDGSLRLFSGSGAHAQSLDGDEDVAEDALTTERPPIRPQPDAMPAQRWKISPRNVVVGTLVVAVGLLVLVRVYGRTDAAVSEDVSAGE